MFEPLKAGGNKKIFYQGKFYQLFNHHKVVFACNPKEYGGGRTEQKLFQDGVAIFNMNQLPASYIYHLLKTEVFDKVAQSNANISQHQDEFLANCKANIVKYQEALNAKEPITIRQLQENALQFLIKKIDSKAAENEYPYAKDFCSKNFVSTSATQTVENALGQFLAIRKKQQAGIMPVCGTNGILIEGASGIGKSALIKAYLEGEEYEKIDSNTPYEEKKRIIIDAFKQDKILWIDEIDTCIDEGIEGMLNDALSGYNPDKEARTAADQPIKKAFTFAIFFMNSMKKATLFTKIASLPHKPL